MVKDKYNPVEAEHLQERERFDSLPDEEKQVEVGRLKEKGQNENADSFYTMLDKKTNPEDREELELALKVCEAVKESGGLALAVGGFARDAVLNKFGYNIESKDIDVEVYGLDFDKLKEILSSLGEVNIVGSAFRVFKLKTLDISIPRRDSKTGKGHKGFKVEGDPKMLIKEAAKRRDFTINALALDPLTGEVLDFYGGVEDIKNKTLRATDKETFVEDPLRVLRAMQFAGRFGFGIDEETKELCRTLDLKELSKERIGEEWMKLLMKAPKPSIGLELARELGILDQLHPEIKALIGVSQNPEYHPEGDAWTHVKMVVDSAAELADEQVLGEEDKRVLMLAALCHDLGKPLATKVDETGKITSHGHEETGIEPAQKVLDMFFIKKDLAERVLLLVRHHMFIHNNPDPTDTAIRRLARKVYPGTIKELANLATADKRGTGQGAKDYDEADDILRRADGLSVKESKPEPLIMGRDLLEIGFKAGKIVGQTLKEIEELQLDGQIVGREQAKEYARKSLHAIELQRFGLGDLEGRIQRGLDPAGMLAVYETRNIIGSILSKVGTSIESVEALTRELHVGAIWTKADDLAKAEKPEVRAWLFLANECHEVNDRDLSQEEYLKDVDRIKNVLELAEKDPETAIDKAVQNIVKKAGKRFTKKDGVPFSEEDAFLFMAIAGEKYGICKAGDLYFVGANELDYSILEKEGLMVIDKEDRGQVATFFQKEGRDIVKKLYPGLAIVFGDEKLALKLAKSGT